MIKRINTDTPALDANPWRHIAILGGTFDPPHYGHASLAEVALNDLKVDQVIIRPSNGNPLKSNSNADFEERLEMCRLLFANHPSVFVSDQERHKPVPTYSYLTAKSLFEEEIGSHYFHFIMGEDCVWELPKWKNLEDLVTYADIYGAGPNVVKARNSLPAWLQRHVGYIEKEVPFQFHSTEIRNKIAQGVYDPFYTPKNVLDYIREHNLYQESKND